MMLNIIPTISTYKYHISYKFIRDREIFERDKFKEHFKLIIPFSAVNSFDDPEDKLDIFNKLILHCIKEYAPPMR